MLRLQTSPPAGRGGCPGDSACCGLGVALWERCGERARLLPEVPLRRSSGCCSVPSRERLCVLEPAAEMVLVSGTGHRAEDF